MRAIGAIQLALFGALISGCAGVRNVLPPIGPLPAAGGTEIPLSASAFNDSVGLNVHVMYGGSPYDKDFARWSSIVLSSGIKHWRDGICPSYFDPHWCNVTLPPRLNAIYAHGISFDLITSMVDTFSYESQYMPAHELAPAVEAYEGPNECDTGRYCPSNWHSTEAAWQQELYTVKSPSVAIVAPSMTSESGYGALGALTAYADFGNIHDYPGAAAPESVTATPTMLQWVAAMTGNKPVWSTEDGYSTDTSQRPTVGVPPVVQERYLPRLLFEHLRLGVMRTYIYQLFDYGTDGGYHMGLLNADYSPKPAWTTLLQLMHIFTDTAPSPRAPLAFSLSGDNSGTLDHVLFQRSDGSYMLALWLAQAVYDPGSGAVSPNASELVTVSLPPATTSATLVPFGDQGVQPQVTLTGSNGIFKVPVRTTVSILQFHP